MKYYRFDLLFSYWIFIWYLLYIFEIIDASPKLALIVGLIENAMLLLKKAEEIQKVYADYHQVEQKVHQAKVADFELWRKNHELNKEHERKDMRHLK